MHVLFSMLFSSKLGCVDDNDGRTVMTTTSSSTMKNNDVCTAYNDAIDTNPMAKAHKFSVSHRKTETKRYDTETDCCFFPFSKVLVLCTANCCCFCWHQWSVFVESAQIKSPRFSEGKNVALLILIPFVCFYSVVLIKALRLMNR